MELLFLAAIAGMLSAFGLQTLSQYNLTKRLRTEHPRLWKDLGSPGVFFRTSPHNALATMGFVWRNDAKALGDPTLARWSRRLRFSHILGFAAFLALITSAVMLDTGVGAP